MAGTWSNKTCFGSSVTPPDIESCAVALTFTNELEVELKADWMSLPATATIERAGCVNMGDDLAVTTTSDISIPLGDTEYQISGGTLTILRGDLAGTYTR
jgi:hypothetical protein